MSEQHSEEKFIHERTIEGSCPHCRQRMTVHYGMNRCPHCHYIFKANFEIN
ncbi:50S ribosomal protein L4 [Levilactobacillus bambusae]|uniref:50S ribosomal protein L4 n=1 Tax=Levilactobacillus bambusae TaxID=2024736 RepID=A0A2V1MXD3_9LACO|nr:50S ribosomal protein L4 [Levilactobacillus bambusae]